MQTAPLKHKNNTEMCNNACSQGLHSEGMGISFKSDMAKIRINTSKADCLMGSMRSMGYTFESAISDVIDNSISANCTFVKLFFPLNPLQVSVCILDDGCGM